MSDVCCKLWAALGGRNLAASGRSVVLNSPRPEMDNISTKRISSFNRYMYIAATTNGTRSYRLDRVEYSSLLVTLVAL